jgi:XTP/dITP diphosphohydrolase
MELLLATRNTHKTREFAELLGDQFEISDLSSAPQSTPVEETGRTFAENAILKAVSAPLATTSPSGGGQDRHLFVIADDSGLEVDALEGAPGIYSARYAGENASDQQNVEKLLRELKARNPSDTKPSARFRCVIALARDGRSLGTFEGAVEGTIVDLPRGQRGFGYDPIFLPNGFDQTFGELSAEIKNRISHRAKAVAALRNALPEVKPNT